MEPMSIFLLGVVAGVVAGIVISVAIDETLK